MKKTIIPSQRAEVAPVKWPRNFFFRSLKALLFIFLLFGFYFSPVASAIDMNKDFEIKYGILTQEEDADGNYHIQKETSIIPYKIGEVNFGYVILPKNNKVIYELQDTLYIPAKAANYGGDIPESAVVEENGTNIKYKAVKKTGYTYHFWTFEKGDPTGRYKVEININGSFVKVINFDVVPQ